VTAVNSGIIEPIARDETASLHNSSPYH